jgi:anti-anti-sigma regulatory factor
MVPQLLIRQGSLRAEIHVGGSIDASTANAFAIALARDVKTLARGDASIHLDFDDLELDDGSAIAEAVNALRELSLSAPVVLRNAPHMLAHTLYKIGMLRGTRLALETPRHEEPNAG